MEERREQAQQEPPRLELVGAGGSSQGGTRPAAGAARRTFRTLQGAMALGAPASVVLSATPASVSTSMPSAAPPERAKPRMDSGVNSVFHTGMVGSR